MTEQRGEQRGVHSGLLNHRSQSLRGAREDRYAQAMNLEDSWLMELLSLETWQASLRKGGAKAMGAQVLVALTPLVPVSEKWGLPQVGGEG